MKLPGHATKINAATKAVGVNVALCEGPTQAAPGNYCFDLVVYDQGCRFPLPAAVDVINADSSSSDLTIFLALRGFWRIGDRSSRYTQQAWDGLAWSQAEQSD